MNVYCIVRISICSINLPRLNKCTKVCKTLIVIVLYVVCFHIELEYEFPFSPTTFAITWRFKVQNIFALIYIRLNLRYISVCFLNIMNLIHSGNFPITYLCHTQRSCPSLHISPCGYQHRGYRTQLRTSHSVIDEGGPHTNSNWNSTWQTLE